MMTWIVNGIMYLLPIYLPFMYMYMYIQTKRVDSMHYLQRIHPA